MIRHGVETGIKLGPQADAVQLHIAVGLVTALVIGEALFDRQPRRAHIKTGFENVAAGIRLAEPAMVEDALVQLNHINAVAVRFAQVQAWCDAETSALCPPACRAASRRLSRGSADIGAGRVERSQRWRASLAN